MATKSRTYIRIAGGPQFIRSREAWAHSDRVTTCYSSGRKPFASPRSAQQWIVRYSSSILPEVWNHLTLGEALEHGLLELVTV